LKKSPSNTLSLFETKATQDAQPLALRMSPQSLDEWAGQNDLLGEGKLLRRAIVADRLSSAIFYGPPGCGKSALARMIARKTQAEVEELNAVTAGVADVRAVIERAKERRSMAGQRTLLILDEIHRFNRSQQDALLPDVERGLITLIGLTTENPFFYVNHALLSRAQAFEFKTLTKEALEKILNNALSDPTRGLGLQKIDLAPEARAHFLEQSNGDARRLLNALELAAMTTKPDASGPIRITLAIAEECVQKRSLVYDKHGDQHYDIISVFIKSMRGSDPDAALYWMARMLASGEDPRFIARRIIICASEDVGNADPQALVVAHAALGAAELVGMPEARIPLAQACTYIATAPKSNAAYLAIDRALEEVEKGPRREVPGPMRDSHNRKGDYHYPHDFPGHFTPQSYWPDPKVLYHPSELGYEAEIKKRLYLCRSTLKANSENSTSKSEKR